MEGHKEDERARASGVQEEAETAGTVKPGEKKVQENLTFV